MRLRHIRLSGFKSFVDPTTLSIPTNLVGVVGPNGCGKSNIIDAVTWVMGESSAKHLRGDNLVDVIFTGSGSRQPVSQASVELVFDNSEHKLGGQYASYNEISVKRQINREGVSTYFLNGTRCRRKDIQGIFLGTGLGPRSYAIIEQGVISRLIEAKPDELRVFIEEAAGISKFRARRRETENRMRHTRENLDRLNDIRSELEKQLAHLQRQARAAERYQTLKQEQRRLEAEVQALNWRELQEKAEQRASGVREHGNRVEQATAALRAVEAQVEKLRSEQSAANEAHSAAQSRFYEVGAAISQIEQKLQHSEERIAQLNGELAKTRSARSDAEQQQGDDRERLERLAAETGSLEPRLRGSRGESDAAYDALNEAEQAIQGWQSEWDTINESLARFSRDIEVDSTRLEHLEADLEDSRRRRQTLTQELERADAADPAQDLESLAEALAAAQADVEARRRDLEARRDRLQGARAAADGMAAQLAELRAAQQEIQGEMGALEALRRAETGADSEAFQDWLRTTGLAEAPRLMDRISVQPGWATALETVLGARLNDLCTGDFETAVARLPELAEGRVGLLGTAAGTRLGRGGGSRLLDMVESPWSLDALLAGVYCAGDLDEALQIRAELQQGESVVTRDGIWLGGNWAVASRPTQDRGGMLAREQRMQALLESRRAGAAAIETLEAELAHRRAASDVAESALQKAQDMLQEAQDRFSEMRATHAEMRTRHDEAGRREQQLRDEIEDLEGQEQTAAAEMEATRRRLERARADRERARAHREELAAVRDRRHAALEDSRTRWRSTHQESHEIALRLEAISSQRASLEQAIERSRVQMQQLDTRLGELAAALEAARAPMDDLRQEREAHLREKLEAERGLSETRGRVESLDTAIREQELARSEAEQRIEECRSELDQARLAAQEITVRIQTVQENLESRGFEPHRLLQDIEEGADPAAWQEKLDAVGRRIDRLGAINLAAIEEYDQYSERKQYLDKQHDDLAEALSTLETAIRKIDRETRTRFKETFDHLNSNLQEMFPILFGGGHAYLEMTGEDLLETGVTIMARPPGKRISNIHLLSGGEKALTAVALVFAIFKLNPAPFCILDEVDAPLDDTNVGRFCNLLSEMSQDVQFIVITHNKITMEIAHQLLGVTMHEAGVSRLVSVDMDEAVQMAASA